MPLFSQLCVSAEFLWKIILGSERLLLTCCEFSPLSVGFTNVKYLLDSWSSKHINFMLSNLYSIQMYFIAFCSLICMHFRNRMGKFGVNCWLAQNWWVLLQHFECWLINLWASWTRHNLFIVKWCVNSSWWGM